MDIVAKAQEVKKAIAGALAVLVAIQAANTDIIPETAKGWIATIVSVLGTFGIVYAAKNEPVTE